MRLAFYLALLSMAGLAAPSAFAQSRRPSVMVQRAGSSYLGIGVLDLTPERAKALNLKDERGAEVAHVDEDGPAAKAGIKEGDVVLQYNGDNVEGNEQFARLVRETPPGRQAKLVIWRNGATQTLTVTVGSRKNTIIESPDGSWTVPPMPSIPPIEIPRFEMSWQNPLLGIEGESLGQGSQLADFFGVRDGVLVRSVIKNSAAEKAGLKAGDVVVKVDSSPVSSSRDITSYLRANRGKRTFTLTIVRNKKEMPLAVSLDDQVGAATPADRVKF